MKRYQESTVTHHTYQNSRPVAYQDINSYLVTGTSNPIKRRTEIYTQYQTYWKCDGISRRSRSWSPFSQFLGSLTYPHHAPRNGPQTTREPHTDWKFHWKGIINNSERKRGSKDMDMRLYWIQDWIKQDHLYVFWKLCTENLGEYFTKHHPPHNHIEMQPIYLHT